MTTRREFLALVPALVAARAASANANVTVPVDILFDKDAKLSDDTLRRFWGLWAEAARDFGWIGLLGLIGGGALAFVMSRSVLVNVVGSVGVLLVAILYCRILGRMMWYCSEKLARLEREKAA